MRYYVFASKPGTEALLGRGELSFVSPNQDLAVELAAWLTKRGWTVSLSDSTERSEPVNNATGAVAVGYLVKQFAEEVKV
jgi:hypothetical protein